MDAISTRPATALAGAELEVLGAAEVPDERTLPGPPAALQALRDDGMEAVAAGVGVKIGSWSPEFGQLVMVMLAQGERPAGGWYRFTGIHAREMHIFRRCPAMRQLALRIASLDSVSPALLYGFYRQRLLAMLEDREKPVDLAGAGRLLEKLPALSARDAATGTGRDESAGLAGNTRALLDSLAACERFLGSSGTPEEA